MASKLMAKMGYVRGSGLGKHAQGRTDILPIPAPRRGTRDCENPGLGAPEAAPVEAPKATAGRAAKRSRAAYDRESGRAAPRSVFDAVAATTRRAVAPDPKKLKEAARRRKQSEYEARLLEVLDEAREGLFRKRAGDVIRRRRRVWGGRRAARGGGAGGGRHSGGPGWVQATAADPASPVVIYLSTVSSTRKYAASTRQASSASRRTCTPPSPTPRRGPPSART